MVFQFQQKVLFKHCDPAGIVFYPRYLEMINDCVEDFFDKEIGWPFEEILRSGGLPTVTTSTVFTAPSRHGDILDFTVRVERLGKTSFDIDVTVWCNKEQRLKNQSRLVRNGPSGRSQAWPEDIRQRLQEILEKQNDN